MGLGGGQLRKVSCALGMILLFCQGHYYVIIVWKILGPRRAKNKGLPGKSSGEIPKKSLLFVSADSFMPLDIMILLLE